MLITRCIFEEINELMPVSSTSSTSTHSAFHVAKITEYVVKLRKDQRCFHGIGFTTNSRL